MCINKKIILVFFLFLFVSFITPGLAYINYSLDEPFSGLAGNSVVEIIYDGYYIWVGTGNGLSRSSNGGATWESFDHTNGLNQDGISAIAYNTKDSSLWVATSYTQVIDGVPIPFGAGFNVTTDTGQVWNSFTPEQASGVGKLAYDMAILDTTIWAACFYGGLIRSKDNGLSWENVFVDSFARDDYENGTYQDFRNRLFAVVADTFNNADTNFIWSGTAAGIFKFVYTTSDSADTIISYQHDDTLTNTISGNFVVSLAVQNYDGKKIIWAGTRPTFTGFTAVSYTTDEGANWSQTLEGDWVYNFDFQDSVVWAATTSGLKRSTDFGYNWEVFNFMQDKDRPDQQILNPEFYAVRIANDTIIWAGGFDGLVKSTDNGQTWKVYRSFEPIGSPQAKTAYAYPNPFSPLIANRNVRIHYKAKSDGTVNIKIYDFEMRLVKTILDDAYRNEGVEYDQTWDGRNEKGDLVANGVYFFKIEGADGQDEWGKIGVLK
jgi:hypothetical protein